MNININQIPLGGLCLEEDREAGVLDLETDTIKFRGPLKAIGRVELIANALSVDLSVKALLYSNCSRCLKEFEMDLKKDLRLNYQVNPVRKPLYNGTALSNGVNKAEPIIDLNPDIRQEIMLDYPLKPLCNAKCKGLCVKCGKNLNDGNCNCN